MKRNAALIIIAAILFTASGCARNGAYSDSVPCSEIMDKAEEQIPIDLGYESFGGEHIEYYFNGTELEDDHSLRYSVLSDDINEMGVLHAPDRNSAKKLCALTEEYLKALYDDKRAFIESYAPKEIPKLEDAEARIYGNYVAYAILSDSDRELFFDTVEKALKIK